jgi:hypothetical protein
MKPPYTDSMTNACVALALTLTLSSCAGLSLPLLGGNTAVRTRSTAEQNFLNGRLEQALQEYEQIYASSISAEDKNGALYGLACTEMILARDDAQLIEAITKLQRWNANKGSADFTENRNLLILALRQQRERLKAKKQQDAVQDKHQQDMFYSQKKKISQMAETVNILKEQLDELERIDKTLQK